MSNPSVVLCHKIDYAAHFKSKWISKSHHWFKIQGGLVPEDAFSTCVNARFSQTYFVTEAWVLSV